MATSSGRTNQKTRTRRAIVDASRELMRHQGSVTMTEVARAALVSEATVYRYFPDLTALLAVSLADEWKTPEEALRPVADSRDPVERVSFAAHYLLEGVAVRQTAVRAIMAATISHPDLARTARPGIRFGLIAEALRPFRGRSDSPPPARLAQLERDLAVVVSSEALFTLTDLCGLPTDEAVASAVCTAKTLTRAAFKGAVATPISQPGGTET